jgi:two-component system osmolarity sensor histidine kinase EnvZ
VTTTGSKITLYLPSKDARHVYKIQFLKKKLRSKTTPTVIIFGASSAIILLLLAFIFLKNQIRPIVRLARAASAFGKGIDDNGYTPEGAKEVRLAGLAFCDMKTSIKRLLDERTQTLAGISHDIRTPLTRMRLQLSLMPASEETLYLLEDVDLITKITESFMLYASKERKEPYSNHNLHNFLQKIIKNNKSRDFYIDLIEGDKSKEIRIMKVLFTRAIENILSNASKFGTRASIAYASTEGNVVISIDDDGPGIAPNIKEKIFDPFVSSTSARTLEKSAHTGLGLSIVKGVVEAHGGTVEASRSESLGGARFTIKIPDRAA